MTAPACARCNQVDRMRSLPSTVIGLRRDGPCLGLPALRDRRGGHPG